MTSPSGSGLSAASNPSRLLVRALGYLLNVPEQWRRRIRCLRMRWACSTHPSAEFTAEATVINPLRSGAISVGERSLVMGELLVIPPNGRISVGDWCYIGPGSKIWSMSEVAIGHRVFISHGVQIFDNNTHSLSAQERHARYRELQTLGRHLEQEPVKTKPVVIEDDVWIGFNAAVLKGVTIGRGAVVGACSVVLHDVPPYSVVGGNPARKIGESRP